MIAPGHKVALHAVAKGEEVRRYNQIIGFATQDIAPGDHPHEAAMLRLDSSKARAELGWRPVLGLTEALNWIMLWHRAFAHGEDARDLTLDQIRIYAALAQSHPTASISKAAA
jgi:hypothetical protein